MISSTCLLIYFFQSLFFLAKSTKKKRILIKLISFQIFLAHRNPRIRSLTFTDVYPTLTLAQPPDPITKGMPNGLTVQA